MTIESGVNDGIVHNGNGVTADWPFPFAVNTASQVEVIIRDPDGDETVLSSNYTVTDFDTEGSGSVHYPDVGSPLAAGYKIAINPKMDYKQSTSIRNQGPFNPGTHEDVFDTLMMHIKELRGICNRAILFKKSSEITGATFDNDPVDGMLLAWDGVTGKIKNVSNSDLTGVVTTSYTQSLLDDSDAPSFMTTLGISAFAQTILDDGNSDALRTTADAERTARNLTAITTLQNTDQVIVADASDSNLSRKITLANFISSLSIINNIIVQKFTTNGTYTPSAGMKFCIIESVGGGGGGGGSQSGFSGATGGGGGSGSYSLKLSNAATVGASQTVTIGSGGAGGTGGATGNPGSAGTATSVGSICVANGGGGGGSSGGAANPTTGGVGGSAGTGDVTTVGTPGSPGIGTTGSSTIPIGGKGGATFLGGAGPAVVINGDAAGNAATANSGSGGGGAASKTTGQNGGNGGSGLVLITEFCSQ